MNTIDIPLEEAPQPRGRRAHRLTTLLVLFLAVAGGSGGTWAAFTASTGNGSSFSTGVLILSNSVEEATACFSTAANDAITTNDATCDELFTVSVTAPGDEDDVEVTVGNEGNLEGALSGYASQVCGTSDAAGTDYHGDDVNVCDDVQVYVQQYVGDTEQDGDTRAGGECLFGLDATDDGVCDGFDGAWHLDRFDTDFPNFNQALDLGTLPPGEARYFRVFVRLDPDAANSAQGLAATFGLSWRLAQS